MEPPPALWRAPLSSVDLAHVDALPDLHAEALQRYAYLTILLSMYVCVMPRVLRPLVGRSLDYTAFSRGLEAGKDPMCTLYRAHVQAVTLPTAPGVCTVHRMRHGSHG